MTVLFREVGSAAHVDLDQILNWWVMVVIDVKGCCRIPLFPWKSLKVQLLTKRFLSFYDVGH